MTEEEVVKLVRLAKERAGGVRALGRQWGVSPVYISDLLNGRRGPGPSLLKPLGLVRIERVTFEKSTS